MKTRLLTTILTSSYLSAMLTSSIAPIRNNATLAAAINPAAAQQALQNALAGIDSAGWAADAATGTPSAVEPAPKAVPNTAPPKADPAMTEELMGRLIKYTRAVKETGAITAQICKALELCDGTKDMPLKYAISDSTDGTHYFGLRPQADSKDILIVVKHPAIMEAYLTDKTGNLRAAAILENGAARLITNEKAAEKFKKEMSLFAGEAAGLPPTTTSSNS